MSFQMKIDRNMLEDRRALQTALAAALLPTHDVSISSLLSTMEDQRRIYCVKTSVYTFIQEYATS